MKLNLEVTAEVMNDILGDAGRVEKWEIDTDPFSNSVGSWFCGDCGGVENSTIMREATRRLLSISGNSKP